MSAVSRSGDILVDIVPALNDNYMYLISDVANKVGAVVDPVEPEKIIEQAKLRGVVVSAILTTHNHWDHAGGNNKMLDLCKTCTVVYGGVGDGVEACTNEVQQGDLIQVGSANVQVLSTPCHTPGHVSYFIDGASGLEKPVVFTGDTMFIGGGGNFNSGTPDQMYHAMCKVLAKLPPETLVYCGHEYTKRNLQFASYAEPNNLKIREKLEWAGQTACTVPSTIQSEWETNPFVRVHEEIIQIFTGETDPVAVMKAVRKMKDEWGKTH